MIDSRIPLGVQPLQLAQATQRQSPLNSLAKLMEMSSMADQSDMNRLKADEYRSGVARQNKLRDILATNPDAAALRQNGFLDESMKLEEHTGKVANQKAAAEKAQMQAKRDEFQFAGQLIGSIKDEATFSRAKALAAQFGIPLPLESYDPAAVDQLRTATLTVQQQMEQAWKAKGYDLDVKKFEETGRHNKATEGIQIRGQDVSASTARRGQDMTDARSREGNDIQRNAARTQVVETAEGVMLVDKGTGLARPAATMNGKPLPGKLSENVNKELTGIRQQNSIIDGALSAVAETPTAFTFLRGAATLAGGIPESLAGRRDSDAERQARSYVFNNVSKVINERAGAAQSAQELARLRSFLPAETDNADQITSKLKAFKTYLGDMEAGTRGGNAPKKPAAPAAGGWSIQKVQ
jgi:hypothetical protein